MADRTVVTRSGASSWRADRFTLICHLARGLAASQTPSCVQARSKTSFPRGTMRPVSSAIGTNSVGETAPRSGWVQRASASKATSSPESSRTMGW